MKHSLIFTFLACGVLLASAEDARGINGANGQQGSHSPLRASAVVTARKADAAATPPPDPTSEAPPVITNDGSGLVVLLDPDLAHEMDNTIREAIRCADGAEFDRENGIPASNKNRRGFADMGQVVCGAVAVLAKAGPGGPLNDILAINTNHPAIQLAGMANRAALAVLELARSYSHIAALTSDMQTLVVNYVTILAFDALMGGVPLGKKNSIPTSLLSSATPSSTSSSSSCPDPTATALVCGFAHNLDNNCEARMPQTSEEVPVCADGEYKDCQCNMPHAMFVHQPSDHLYKWLSDINSRKSVPTDPQPVCNNERSTSVPEDSFLSDKSNVYENFCEAWDRWDKGNELKWTVDSLGVARAPDPASLDFDLAFLPKAEPARTDCKLPCRDSFAKLSNGCAVSWTSSVPYMVRNGTIDVGCGFFSFDIRGQPAQKTLLERQCFGPDDFGKHKDVHENDQESFARYVCSIRDTPLRRGDGLTAVHYEKEAGGVPYQYNIGWNDVCVLGGGNEQKVAEPIFGTSCVDLMIDNFKQCNNGGVGGRIQAGCLVYEFKAASAVFGG